MRRFIFIVLIILNCLLFSSCYQDSEENSLNDYIDCINKNGCGYSSCSIDNPKYFLPDISFFEKYNYIEGEFYWREDDLLRGLFITNVNPEIAFLYLKYEDTIYYSAKEYMLRKIEPYNNIYYEYNDYIFYENSNYIDSNNISHFPEHFTMACYNDNQKILIFMGLCSDTLAGPSCISEKYLEDIESNWKSFIDTYFGKCYDFSV